MGQSWQVEFVSQAPLNSAAMKMPALLPGLCRGTLLPAFSSALPDFSFQIFPQEPTPPMAVPLERQAASGDSNSPAQATWANPKTKSAATVFLIVGIDLDYELIADRPAPPGRRSDAGTQIAQRLLYFFRTKPCAG
jgi:hypothetical protein